MLSTAKLTASRNLAVGKGSDILTLMFEKSIVGRVNVD
jgi:hypothetical protein